MKTAYIGSVAAVLLLVAGSVACSVTQDEVGGASSAVENETPATSGRATGRTGRATAGRANADGGTATTPTTPRTDGGAPAAGPTCYAGNGNCEPTNPDACGKGETCDINGNTGTFECFPPPNDALLGDFCNNSAGPFCAHGLACDQGTCKTYCCDDSQCASGTTCLETGTVGAISIKVCL